MKARIRNLNVVLNIVNDWIYCAYRNMVKWVKTRIVECRKGPNSDLLLNLVFMSCMHISAVQEVPDSYF